LYVIAQLAGGILGAVPLLAWGAIGRSVAFGATTPGVGVPVWLALVGETGVTFLFIAAIFAIAAHERSRRWTPLAIPVVPWCGRKRLFQGQAPTPPGASVQL
jgi:aquaporin Z